jgi:flagellin-like hook-associated protein FlgL
VQTAEGALTETHSILQRMRDLSVQASNEGGLNDEAKGNIQSELTQLKAELNRITDTTTFNGKKLLDGSFSAAFQVGSNAGETISVAIGAPSKGMDAAGLGVDSVDVTATGKYSFVDDGTAAAGKVAETTAADDATAAEFTITTHDAAVEFADGGGNFNISAFKDLKGTITFRPSRLSA